MAILLNLQDSRFKFDVAAEPGGQNIKLCFACGQCTGSCPVSRIDPDYNPRRIIHMVLLGMRREVLSSDFIWMCSQCYTCQAHCPQNVDFADVMKALRTMALREGHVHESFLRKVMEIDSYCQEFRHRMVGQIIGGRTAEVSVEVAKLAEQTLRA
jgi:heterodisulfide reductase subunit C